MKMRKLSKKLLALMLVCLFLFIAGCGESGKGDSVEPLAETNQIPEDGIITKEQFETVAGESKQIQFTGQAEDGTSYTWTFNANLIKNPQDQNLNIIFDSNVLDSVKAQAADAVNALKMSMDAKGLIAVPELSVTVPGLWEANSAVLVKEENGALTEIGEVTVTKDEAANTTTLTMNVISRAETCYVIGKAATVAVVGNEETDSSTTDSSETSTVDKAETTTTKNAETTTAKKSETTTAKKSETTTAKKTETTTAKKEETTTSAPKLTCTISISCATILDNMDDLDPAKKNFVPSNGWILKKTTVTFEEGESVFDILLRVCQSKGIQMEFEETPMYNSAYIEGINNLYEFDCGSQSGWMYKVNGWFPNYGCSQYKVSEGDNIAWVYTCNLGEDVGDNSMQ